MHNRLERQYDALGAGKFTLTDLSQADLATGQNGGPGWDRTSDPSVMSRLLCH